LIADVAARVVGERAGGAVAVEPPEPGQAYGPGEAAHEKRA
jgi:hypothetical protein